MQKTSQTHTESPCWIFHSVRSFSRLSVLLLSVQLWLCVAVWIKDDIWIQISPCSTLTPVFVLFLSFFFTSFLSLMIWNTRDPCSRICGLVLKWSERARTWETLACVRRQCLESPFPSLLRTQTSAEQWAGTLVCIKLSTIAAIISKSKAFHCALFLHHCVPPFRQEASGKSTFTQDLRYHSEGLVIYFSISIVYYSALLLHYVSGGTSAS